MRRGSGARTLSRITVSLYKLQMASSTSTHIAVHTRPAYFCRWNACKGSGCRAGVPSGARGAGLAIFICIRYDQEPTARLRPPSTDDPSPSKCSCRSMTLPSPNR